MKITEQEIKSLTPCKNGLVFCKSCNFDIVKIWNTCERGDWLIWLLCKTKQLDKPKAVSIAIACAKHVLHIYEKNSQNKAPQNAIKAAQEWLNNPCEETRKVAYAAANAANDADAAATNAAYAAAYAAYATDATYYAATDAAADAAYAAAYAAYATDATYDDATNVAYDDAAYAAANAVNAAAYAAKADAAYAAKADAAYAAELKWQANKIRELVTIPYEYVQTTQSR